MTGSLLVGVAEVVVYSGYIRRVGEAKGKEGKVKEVKEIVKTWVVGGNADEGGKENKSKEAISLVSKEQTANIRERKRQKEGT